MSQKKIYYISILNKSNLITLFFNINKTKDKKVENKYMHNTQIYFKFSIYKNKILLCCRE